MSEPTAPTAAAPARAALPKRFFAEALVGEAAGAFVVLLDGRPVRTPGGRVVEAASRALAERLAAEWAAQGDVIDPATMPLTRLVAVALDAVAPNPGPVRAEIVKYAGSDLLVYRAGEPAGLVARQAEHWDPVLVWAREAFGARFVLAEGVMFVAQPPEAVGAVAAEVESYEALGLAALHVMTTLTGSALLALAVARGQLAAETAWRAAHVDEDWNILFWGADEEAQARRSRRWIDMEAAATVATLVRRAQATS
jgi:chaperone required for assembly of F1-ATPase